MARRVRLAAAGLLAAAMCGPAALGTAAPARADSVVNGSGSTYVALAMDQWVRDAQTRGMRINYNGTLGSPAGVDQYAGTRIDFAGTEAEVRSLYQGDPNLPRGYQYVPDVAGAVALMYNVKDAAGKKVDWLHLDQRTIARIFTGQITNWSDPAISRTNGGVKLPNKPIYVVYRSGRSGTTALFYDFVREAAPDVYGPWRKRLGLPDHRIVELPTKPPFVPNPLGFGDSDSIAQFISSSNGAWSIGYDEFGYAKKHGAPAAWVQNGAGKYVLPYAENISEALESARLRPDLSQELSGVYRSKNRKAYPISAYSYLMTQCAPTSDRPTCRGKYADAGKAGTLSKFMHYVACEGQKSMARIGYSPLPTNLSQEMVNAIARMSGGRPTEKLTASNCANPRFHGSLGPGATSPPDPFEKLPGGVDKATDTKPGQGPGGPAGQGPGGPAANGPGGAGPGTAKPTGPSAPGLSGSGPQAVGGGSGNWRNADPVAFDGPGGRVAGMLPLLVLLAIVAVPPATMAFRRWITGLRQAASGR